MLFLLQYIGKNFTSNAILHTGKGKKLYDQRQDIKKRDWERDQGRILKNSKTLISKVKIIMYNSAPFMGANRVRRFYWTPKRMPRL